MLRLGRLPGLSACKNSESVSTTNIGLFAPLFACLTLGRLPYADLVTWLVVARRAGACEASERPPSLGQRDRLKFLDSPSC